MKDADLKGLMRITAMCASGLTLRWWTDALASIAQEERLQSPTFLAFRATLSVGIPEAATLPFGELLVMPLAHGQKLLLMGMVDAFLTTLMCNSGDEDGWLAAWSSFEATYRLPREELEEVTGTIPRDLIARGWTNLRASAS